MSTPRSLKLAAGALAAGSASTQAGIVVFDFPDFTYDSYGNSGGAFVRDINLAAGTFSFNIGAGGFNLQTSYTQDLGFYGYGVYVSRSGFEIQTLAAGATISSATTFDYDLGRYAVPRGTFYVGLARAVGNGDYNYGWFELSSVEIPNSGGLSEVTYHRFAFNDVAGQAILAGQTTAVPEASTLGFAGGLFGLVAAAHLRRRKAKQAAAPDSLLKLAAGRGVRD